MKTNILRLILMLSFFGLTACNNPLPTTTATLIPTSTPVPTPTFAPRIRTEVDMPDDLEGMYQVHVMYAVPRGGQSLDRDLDGSIENSVRLFNDWLFEQTEGYKLRFDTYEGRLDITYLDLPATEETILQYNLHNMLESTVAHLFPFQPNKIYLVYYEGMHYQACGTASWPPNSLGKAGFVYLGQKEFESEVRCVSSLSPLGAPNVTYPSFIDFVGLHETLHILGFNPDCDRSVIMRDAHTHDDNRDIMWDSDNKENLETDFAHTQLDPGHDDYYKHNIPGCPDLANSIFLDPLPENPELPPQEPPAWYRP